MTETPRPHPGPTTVDGGGRTCDVPRCPMPDHPSHYHCGACLSADVTSMYGHEGNPRGCPTPPGDLPELLARHVQSWPGMSAWPVHDVPDGRVRVWLVRAPGIGARRPAAVYWAYRGDRFATVAPTSEAAVYDATNLPDTR